MTGGKALKEQSPGITSDFLFLVQVHPPLLLDWLKGAAIRCKLPKYALLAAADRGVLRTAESEDLKAIFSEGAGLIEDHKINSAADIHSGRRDAVDLSSF